MDVFTPKLKFLGTFTDPVSFADAMKLGGSAGAVNSYFHAKTKGGRFHPYQKKPPSAYKIISHNNRIAKIAPAYKIIPHSNIRGNSSIFDKN